MFTGLAAVGVIVAIIVGIIGIAAAVCQIIGLWKTFQKAKIPGWAAIIPFYNSFKMVQMVGLELWWFVAILLSSAINVSGSWIGWVVGLAVSGFTNYKVAKSFGKDTGFAVGLTLLGPVFWLILGLGDAKYKGPDGPYTMPKMKSGK